MSPGVNAIGVNCVSPDVAQAALATMRQLTEKPLLAYPNSGESFQDGAWCGERHDLGWMVPGLWAVGGCCRVYPEDIAALAKTRNRE
jgi:homocysteine S-methyltransferase